VADFDNDPLTGVFAGFRDEVAPLVRSAGTARVRERVRARRRHHAIALVVLAALVIAIPAAAYAAIGGHRQPAPATTVQQRPGTGRISAGDLGRATLDVPKWAPDAVFTGCPSGSLKFVNGSHAIRATQSIHLEQVVYADVDGNGSDETVARFACVDEESTYQVVAFDRDSAGRIVTLGQVVRQTGPIKAICDLRAGNGGTIEVEVGDYPAALRCYPGKAPLMKTQWRTYAWTGAQFAQSAGPTSFPAVVTSNDLLLYSDGKVTFNGDEGVLDLSVHNAGKSSAPFQVVFRMPVGAELTAIDGSCDGPPAGYRGGNLACGGTVEPQTTLALLFHLTRIDTKRQTRPITVHVRPNVGYTDPDLNNNDADFTFTYR
jgi:hypothetical protein